MTYGSESEYANHYNSTAPHAESYFLSAESYFYFNQSSQAIVQQLVHGHLSEGSVSRLRFLSEGSVVRHGR